MTIPELFQLHDDLCREAKEIMSRKNQDYSAGDKDDPFKNFKGSLIFGVQPEVGTMIRMNDKFMRVKAFIENGQLAVQDEGIRDIGCDLINYTVLMIGQLYDRAQQGRPLLTQELDAPFRSTKVWAIEPNRKEQIKEWIRGVRGPVVDEEQLIQDIYNLIDSRGITNETRKT